MDILSPFSMVNTNETEDQKSFQTPPEERMSRVNRRLSCDAFWSQRFELLPAGQTCLCGGVLSLLNDHYSIMTMCDVCVFVGV